MPDVILMLLDILGSEKNETIYPNGSWYVVKKAKPVDWYAPLASAIDYDGVIVVQRCGIFYQPDQAMIDTIERLGGTYVKTTSRMI